MPPQPASNGLAITGFVCGLVGFLICLIPFGVFFGGIVAIVGIAFGFVGRSRARETGTGRGMATAGAVLGILALVVGVAWLFAVGSIFRNVTTHLEINANDFSVSPDSCQAHGPNTFDATGSVTNVTNSDKLLVQVNVTVRDSRGRVVGTAQDFIGGVAAHNTHAYFASGPLDVPTETSLNCTVTVS